MSNDRHVAAQVFSGGGEMGALMRATDWSKTPLGPVETWPRSLRTMLGVVLGSRFPMLLWWGPDLLHLYNDAYRPILRDKHPGSLAAPAAEVWAEVWDVAGPMARGVQEGGPATWTEDLQLFIHNGTMAEETYFTFSYSPVPGDDGEVGGLLNTVQETTVKVQSERQIRMLQELSERTADATSERDAYRLAAEVLAGNELDLPFVLLYATTENGEAVELVGAGGLAGYVGPANDGRVSVAADTVAAGGGAFWPLAEAARRGTSFLVEDVTARFGPLPLGPRNERPERAIVFPLTRAGQDRPYAFLIAGVSPHRTLDERYQRFFEATADRVMSAVANARAYETERKRAEALAEVDLAKTAFFSSVSHEFRTPLTLILGPTADAVARGGGLDREALELVHRNALRLMKLVNALLDFSRIEAGRVQASYEATDLGQLTMHLAGAFRSAVEHAGLALDASCEPIDADVFVDRDMWEKIVLNLLSNALKFTFQGTIHVSLRSIGEEVELVVRDTGTGIPEAELPNVFKRFHRVRGARSRSHEGSGIGLALVHELARLHGGSVTVSSQVDRGTTFTVRLPQGSTHLPEDQVVADRDRRAVVKGVAPFVEEAMTWSGVDAGAKAELPADASSEVTGDASRARILVVDDNPDLRAYISSLLRPSYVVDSAVDGVDGLEAARRNKPTLILSDVMMPRLDGFGLLSAVRAEETLRGVPVILLSARAGEEATIEGLESGADDYLVKPFAARELLARVRTHVELVRQRDLFERAKEIAEAANRELEAFSYSVAHDLRAPLRSIDGFSQAILEDCGDQLDASGRRYLDLVRQSAQLMAQLIDDILTLSQVTRAELRFEPVDLSAMVRDVVARLARADPARAVRAEIEEGLVAHGDRRLLSVVFENLLANAWKFSSKRADARIQFGVTTLEERPVFFVRDNGAGFDMRYAGKLFGVFQRMHAAHEFEGTGVGLATVQRVVERHGGRVWAEGVVGEGATFYFTLTEKGRAA